ncbi:MAG: HNH endonuclease family protein [Gordonia sp. (in: high G+C Gram-positive bacteria)]|uniref:HNH endonuclease family protein n=1 Tax=Gordonia sp. (in: high G+C Gram-positive bacteria) TaxID=84139 RepID=UPI0039E49D6F
MRGIRIVLPRTAWLALIVAVALAVFAAGSLVVDRWRAPSPSAAGWLAELERIPRVAARLPHRSDYLRSAFGAAWADATDAAGGNNACDTRNDILRRDLGEMVTTTGPKCAATVTAGRLRSPYTGRVLVFRRSRATAVQIDHIVPLSYAWDMGAHGWSSTVRLRFANDPANLVAVDERSNQDKKDLEPARWMPPARGFHCQYAKQFVAVLVAYPMLLDEPSARTLRRALRGCG